MKERWSVVSVLLASNINSWRQQQNDNVVIIIMAKVKLVVQLLWKHDSNLPGKNLQNNKWNKSEKNKKR